MRFIIKPDDTSLNTVLEAIQYRRLWRENARKLHQAFREVTGLEFQQHAITARVTQGNKSYSGWRYHPMVLRGDNQPPDCKLMLMIHELSHRLVTGNALAPWNLGIIDSKEYDKESAEISHQHMYLFEYDVVKLALGDAWADTCRRFEEHTTAGSPHDRAWRWAMGLTYEQRQRALKWLAVKALTRDRWHELDGKKMKPIKPEAWRQKLTTAATQSP